jgi:tetratricopeptide (TPR) repeat protein
MVCEQISCGFLDKPRLTAQSARMRNPRFFDPKKLGIFILFLAITLPNLRAQSVDASAPASALPAADSGSNEALRAYLQLQEQIHDTQLSIERNRLQAQAAAAQEAMALSNRLQAIEQSMTFQRSTDLEEAQRTNHMLLGVLGIFAAIGLGAVLLMVYFQSRAVSRLADISTALAASRQFALPAAGSLGFHEADALTNGSVEQSNSRLTTLVQHLERRIAELEQTATALPLKEPQAPPSNGEPKTHPELALNSDREDQSSPVLKLMERGQSLISSDRPEDAIACFDEILAMEPNNAEALVKKGTALEKMRQPQEALEYYDRAIAADGSLTIAYLHKGGLCSRLEKYGDAMECYERALHTQEKKQAA